VTEKKLTEFLAAAAKSSRSVPPPPRAKRCRREEGGSDEVQLTVAQMATKQAPASDSALAAPSTAAGVSLDHLLRALPDFGGRLAELLWEVTGKVQELTFGPDAVRIVRRRPEPAIPALLSANREIQLLAIIGIKERRVVSLSQDTHPQLSRSYAMMCDSLYRACPEAWAESRKMRLCPTEHADKMAALQLLAACGIPV